METFPALLALCAGNSPVTAEFPTQRPMTQNFDVFFDLHLNKRLSKQSWGWWFETPSRPLWRHCNVLLFDRYVCSYTFAPHILNNSHFNYPTFEHLTILTRPHFEHPTIRTPRILVASYFAPHDVCRYNIFTPVQFENGTFRTPYIFHNAYFVDRAIRILQSNDILYSNYTHAWVEQRKNE